MAPQAFSKSLSECSLHDIYNERKLANLESPEKLSQEAFPFGKDSKMVNFTAF